MNLVANYFAEKRNAIAAFTADVESVARDIAEANPDLDGDDIETAVSEHFYGDPQPFGTPVDVFRVAACKAMGATA